MSHQRTGWAGFAQGAKQSGQRYAKIQIQPASSELVPGRTTRIPIVVVVENPLKVRGLHATFHGAEETKATYTTYNAATKTTQTQTAVECVDIIKTDYVLSGREQKGFFGNIADGLATIVGSGDHDVLEPGEYPFEVDVQLPSDTRPSFAGRCTHFFDRDVDNRRVARGTDGVWLSSANDSVNHFLCSYVDYVDIVTVCIGDPQKLLASSSRLWHDGNTG